MSIAQQTEKEGWLTKQGGVIKSWQKSKLEGFLCE